MTPAEAKTFLQSYITKINEQDNRCTATPYFYVIQDEVEYRDEHNPEYYVLFDDDYCEVCRADCEDDLVDAVMDAEKIEDREEAEAFIEKYHVAGMSTRWEEKGCFFTETDAKGHLESNRHHYKKNARTYVKHFWRAPEVKQFFEAVSVLAEIEMVQH